MVSRDVAPYTIVAGNPAVEVRRRLSPDDAERMRAIAWWDWPMDRILKHEDLICGTDLDALEACAASYIE